MPFLIMILSFFLWPAGFALAEPLPPADPGVQVSRIVGEAGGNFVTSREAKIDNALEQALYGFASAAKNTKPIRILTGDEENFPGEVANTLLELVIYLEAKSFSSELMPKAEVQKSIKLALEKLGANRDWLALEPSIDEMQELLERKMISKQFIHLKTDSSLVPVSDEEALAYFKKNRLKFGNLPFASFKENIKAFLIKSQTDQRLKSWYDVLNRKYKVRNFIAG